MMCFILIILIGYIIPLLLCWRWAYLAMSPDGVGIHRAEYGFTFFFSAIPIFNIVGMVMFWLTEYPIKESRRKRKHSWLYMLITLGNHKFYKTRNDEDKTFKKN